LIGSARSLVRGGADGERRDLEYFQIDAFGGMVENHEAWFL
jgi:hypothetical protein